MTGIPPGGKAGQVLVFNKHGVPEWRDPAMERRSVYGVVRKVNDDETAEVDLLTVETRPVSDEKIKAAAWDLMANMIDTVLADGFPPAKLVAEWVREKMGEALRMKARELGAQPPP